MHAIGRIDEERLKLIPMKYRNAHEFSFFLHDRLVDLLGEFESKGFHNIVENSICTEFGGREKVFEGMDILGFLKKKASLNPLYMQHVNSHLVLALTSDMLHFLYESLTCFEKRKFTVGFALLRKPLKENLLFLSWLLADQNDFITRFEANNFETLHGVPKDKKIEIFNKAIHSLSYPIQKHSTLSLSGR